MRFLFTVEVEVLNVQGRAASREEIRDQIVNALDDANPKANFDTEEGGKYVTDTWNVEVTKQ